MPRILAIIAAGIVDNVIVGDPALFPGAIDVTDTVPRPAPGWLYEAGDFTPPADNSPPEKRHVTRLAFRNRFTLAELTAIEIACLDVPTASTVQRQQAAALRVMQRQVDTATYIDLERPDTRAGVQQLEAMGVIAAGRALQILDAPIQPAEAPTP